MLSEQQELAPLIGSALAQYEASGAQTCLQQVLPTSRVAWPDTLYSYVHGCLTNVFSHDTIASPPLHLHFGACQCALATPSHHQAQVAWDCFQR